MVGFFPGQAFQSRRHIYFRLISWPQGMRNLRAIVRWPMKPSVMAAWLGAYSTLFVPVCSATSSDRELPRLYSFYLDDESCSEHAGEATRTVIWNGRPWNLTAPVEMVSPPSETKRNGTPLIVRPLDDFVTQAQRLGATIPNSDRPTVAVSAVQLRLVLAVHDLVAEEAAKYSLQTIIVVRLCSSIERGSASALHVGPREGVYLTDWWGRRKSERWINGYREAFSLSVADALEWAADEVNVMRLQNVQ